jgi:hypothetical protein
MGVFNALIAVRADRTHIEYNLALELERLLQPWIKRRFDWYSIGITYPDMGFASYFDEINGWEDCWRDEDEPDITQAEWYEQLAKWVADLPKTHVLVPIRCHD